MIGKTHFRLRNGRFVPPAPEYFLSHSPSLSRISGKQNYIAEDETTFDLGSESISCPGFFSEIDLME